MSALPWTWRMEAWAYRMMASKKPARWDEYVVALDSATTEICRLRAKLRRPRRLREGWPEDEVSV